jgi:hypothetical protein
MTPSWRELAQRVIAEVRRAHPESAGPELRRLLHGAYPFGQRRYHPYRIWCDEVRRALGKPRKTKSRSPRVRLQAKAAAATLLLFDGGER